MQLLERLALKVTGIPPAQDLAEQRLAQDAVDVVVDLPHLGIAPLEETLGGPFLEVLDDGCVHVGDVLVVAAPLIDIQPLLLVEEGLEQPDVR